MRYITTAQNCHFATQFLRSGRFKLKNLHF